MADVDNRVAYQNINAMLDVAVRMGAVLNKDVVIDNLNTIRANDIMADALVKLKESISQVKTM